MQSMDYNYDHSNLTRKELLDKKSNLLNAIDDINNCLELLDKSDDISISSGNKRIKLNHYNNDNNKLNNGNETTSVIESALVKPNNGSMTTSVTTSTLVKVNNGMLKSFPNLLIIKILKLAIEGEQEYDDEKEYDDDEVKVDDEEEDDEIEDEEVQEVEEDEEVKKVEEDEVENEDVQKVEEVKEEEEEVDEEVKKARRIKKVRGYEDDDGVEDENEDEEDEENQVDDVGIDQRILGYRYDFYSNIKLVCKDWNAHVIPRLDINNYLFINEHDAIYNYLKVMDTIKHLMNRNCRTGYHISNNETITKLVSELPYKTTNYSYSNHIDTILMGKKRAKELSIQFNGDPFRDIEESSSENINVSSGYKYLKYNGDIETISNIDSNISTIKSIANEVNRVMKKRNVNSGVFLNNLYRSNEKESNLVGFDSLIYNVFKSYFGEKRIQICNFIITKSKWDEKKDCGVPIVGDCKFKITKVSSKTMNHSFDKTKNAHTLLFNTSNFGRLLSIFDTFIGTGLNGPEPNYNHVSCLSAITIDL